MESSHCVQSLTAIFTVIERPRIHLRIKSRKAESKKVERNESFLRREQVSNRAQLNNNTSALTSIFSLTTLNNSSSMLQQWLNESIWGHCSRHAWWAATCATVAVCVCPINVEGGSICLNTWYCLKVFPECSNSSPTIWVKERDFQPSFEVQDIKVHQGNQKLTVFPNPNGDSVLAFGMWTRGKSPESFWSGNRCFLLFFSFF